MPTKNRKIFFVGSVSNPYQVQFGGGQKVTLNQAETLRKFGYDAYVVTNMGKRERIRYWNRPCPSIFISRKRFHKLLNKGDDLVVLPGRYAEQLDDYPGDNKILFSQGAFITLASLSRNPRGVKSWKNPRLKAIMCVSEGNAEIFKELRPDCPVLVIPNQIETPPKPCLEREKRLLFPALNRAEKNPLDTTAALQMIFAKMKIESRENSEFVELVNLPFPTVQELLHKSSVLLFPGFQEGAPLLILEAIAAGTIVLGYNRTPISDLLHPSCLFEIGELSRLASVASSILESPNEWADVRAWQRSKASEYNAENHLGALHKAWQEIELALQIEEEPKIATIS